MVCDKAADWARIWQQFAPKSLKLIEVRHKAAGGELLFAKTELGRNWRFDWAMPSVKVAVEIDGGVYSRGRHVRGRGFERDCEKMNAAAILGWAVLRFTPQMLKRDTLGCVAVVAKMIKRRMTNEL